MKPNAARFFLNPKNRSSPRRFAPLPIVLLTLGYVIASPLTSFFNHPRFGVQPLNLHPALALAAASLRPPLFVLGMAAVVCGTWFLEQKQAVSLAWLPWWSLTAVSQALAYFIAAHVLRLLSRWGRRPALTAGIGSGLRFYVQDLNILLLVALVTAGWCAFADAVRQIGQDPSLWPSAPELAWRWFVANLLGMVVWSPVVMYGRAAWNRLVELCGATRLVFRDLVIYVGVLAMLLWVVFGQAAVNRQPMAYLVFLPVVGMAMRYGLAGAVFATPMAQVGLMLALVLGGNRPLIAFEFQMLVLALAVCALYLGALADQRLRDAQLLADRQRRLRERSEALEAVQRKAATSELAAAVAHDLSQPISAIGTFALAGQQILAKKNVLYPDLFDVLRQIQDESVRAGRFLHRMRDFFREGSFRVVDVDLNEIVRDLHAYWDARLAEDHIVLVCVPQDGEAPLVQGDAVQITAILGNLIANARDAIRVAAQLTPASNDIRVTLGPSPDRPDQFVRVCVTDSGPGIASAMKGNLFQPLRTTKAEGMGLGLALSRSIAQRMGGQLWCESTEAPTQFCLELPFLKRHANH